MKVWTLPHVKSELLWLPMETRYEVATGLDRLEREPTPPGAERIRGTQRLYRWRRGECRILYVLEGERIVIVSLSDRPRRVPERLRRPTPELDDDS
jgi:mRNA-degrading endonuclease RelE of RelBE toxin-antitoxin system